MITGFTEITIEVPALGEAAAEYSRLLGLDLLGPDLPRANAPLRNVAIRLRENPARAGAAIAGLGLLTDGADADTLPDDRRGLALSLAGERQVMAAADATATGIVAVDHLVLMSRDADDCIRLFGEGGCGMRLALDQEVPEWGGRMLFFRCGKMTLEVIQNLKEPPERDFFWGITYLTPDLGATLSHLDSAGVAHSDIRAGRKPGTRVATIKSHHLGLPGLLIEPAA